MCQFPGNESSEERLGSSEDHLASNCTEEVDLDNRLNHHVSYSPNLTSIESTLRWGFHLHAYGFGCLFFFLAFYAFFSILNLRSQLSSRPYMSTINSFLCLLGVSRAAGLFIDPYNLRKALPTLMGTLLWDLGFPCLISSFSLIQIAFLQLTQSVPQHKLCQLSPDSTSIFVVSQWNDAKTYSQLDLGPEKFRKKTCLSVIITIHFVAVIASAFYSSFNSDLVLVKLVTQLAFALWGFLLCATFLYAGKRVLGILGQSGGPSSKEASSLTSMNTEKGLVGLGLLAPGQNLASSLTAALAPTLLQASTPKIKITDENDRTISVASDSSRLNDNCEPTNGGGGSGRPCTPTPGPSSCKSSSAGGEGHRPPSPVLPRRKSTGTALRLNSRSSRRLSLNKQEGAVIGSEETTRKKSLTWTEKEGQNKGEKGGKSEKEPKGSEITQGIENNGKRRSSSRKSSETTVAQQSESNNIDRAMGIGNESLLSTGGPDFTLQSILSHIAYVNQTALDYRLSRKMSRKNQVHKVIKYTSVTAILGVLLCIGELIRIIGPFGIFAAREPPTPWHWFALQTICRLIEFAMGAVIANITKQPVNRPHHYAYSIRHKHQRESLYL